MRVRIVILVLSALAVTSNAFALTFSDWVNSLPSESAPSSSDVLYLLHNPSSTATAEKVPISSLLTDGLIPDTITVSGYVRKSAWTDHDNYPADCTSGQAVTGLADTLTCAVFLRSSDIDTYSELSAIVTDRTLMNTTDPFNPLGRFDFASGTLGVPRGTALPGTCATGDEFMDTDAGVGQKLYLCVSTNTWEVVAASGVGDVSGPASATSTAVAIYNGAGGKTIKNSGVLVDASNNVTGVNSLIASGSGTIVLNGLTIAASGDLSTTGGIKAVPRITTTASSATPSINVDTTDEFTITALAAAITSMTSGLSGTPVNGQKLIVRILDNGTARAIAWGASFASRGATLPTTTVLSKYLYVGFIYNTTTSTWDCIAVSQEQ